MSFCLFITKCLPIFSSSFFYSYLNTGHNCFYYVQWLHLRRGKVLTKIDNSEVSTFDNYPQAFTRRDYFLFFFLVGLCIYVLLLSFLACFIGLICNGLLSNILFIYIFGCIWIEVYCIWATQENPWSSRNLEGEPSSLWLMSRKIWIRMDNFLQQNTLSHVSIAQSSSVRLRSRVIVCLWYTLTISCEVHWLGTGSMT